MSDRPAVSVIMATFNTVETLQETLESIAAQTLTDWELVVCDDASTDNTVRMLEDFAAQHPGKVTILRNDVNSRLSYSLNRCLEHARGDLVARMDADDRSVPTRLAIQSEYLNKNPDVALVGSAMQRFDNQGLKDVLELKPRPERWDLRYGVTFAHATVMVRREAYETLGGYTVSKRTARGQDYDLWFRFYAAGYLGHNLSEPLYQVREDDAAMRRRTLPVRWRAYKTALIGFRLLGFPKSWYITPTIALAKGFVPYRGIAAYRRYQARKSDGKVLDRLDADT